MLNGIPNTRRQRRANGLAMITSGSGIHPTPDILIMGRPTKANRSTRPVAMRHRPTFGTGCVTSCLRHQPFQQANGSFGGGRPLIQRFGHRLSAQRPAHCKWRNAEAATAVLLSPDRLSLRTGVRGMEVFVTIRRRGNVEAPGGIDRICHDTFFILKVARSALLTGEVKSCPTKMPPCAKPTKLRLPSESIEGRHGGSY
jgi:hypothetical protein